MIAYEKFLKHWCDPRFEHNEVYERYTLNNKGNGYVSRSLDVYPGGTRVLIDVWCATDYGGRLTIRVGEKPRLNAPVHRLYLNYQKRARSPSILPIIIPALQDLALEWTDIPFKWANLNGGYKRIELPVELHFLKRREVA